MIDQAADVSAFITSRELGPVVLVGTSSGGYIAQQVAVDRPDLVAGLVLVGAPLRLDRPFAWFDEVMALTDPIDADWVRAFTSDLGASTDIPASYLKERTEEALAIPAAVWQATLKGW